MYFIWFTIFLGIIFYLSKNNCLKNNFLFNSLILSSLLYTLFIATITVESRLGFIIFLLLLPFSGVGIKYIYHLHLESTSKVFFIKNNFKLFSTLFLFILAFFYLSFWLDLQTNRLDWFNEIFNITQTQFVTFITNDF